MRRLFFLLISVFRTGRGRPLAVTLLVALTVFAFLTDLSPFRTLRLDLFDAYQTYLPRTRNSAPAVIVGIDEASLNAFGQWPWPRTQLAALIERIAEYGPAAIGIDIIMPEADRTSPPALAEQMPQIGRELRARLTSLPDNDRILASVISGKPVVLGAAGFDHKTPTTATAMRSVPVVVRGGDVYAYLRHFSSVLKSLPSLEAAAAGEALLSADLEKGVVRRVPLVAAVGEVIVPSLSVEMIRVAAGLPTVEITAGPRGMQNLILGDLQIPTSSNGEAWVHYTPFLPDRYVSAADVLAGRVNPEQLQQKLVLVGLTGLGLVDYRTTPRGERVPGIEVHAQLLENMFDQRFLLRPYWMQYLEAVVLLLAGAVLVYAVPVVKPRLSAVLALLLFGGALGLGVLIYRTGGLLFDAASLSLSLGIVFLSLLGSTLIEADRERRLANLDLQRQREAAARVAGELEAARRIQMGSLPQAARAFRGEDRFALDAILESAREVGGDLYDFFMVDEDRLFFVVGDVSGKGLPACLFMIMTKALVKSVVLGDAINVRQVINRVNVELARENPEMLFVTVVAGMLDVRNGALEYCIAGHDAPWQVTREGNVLRLGGEGTIPLGVLEEFDYPLQKIQLEAGDAICVVTDGITEAMNEKSELYGSERVTNLLGKKGAHLPPAKLAALLRDDVDAFVGDAEPSDDLTLLVFSWYGPRVS